MAILWSNVAAGGSALWVADASFAYWISTPATPSTVRQFDPSSDTNSTIGSGGDWDDGGPYSGELNTWQARNALAMFKGELYATIHQIDGLNRVHQLWKWDGTPNNWTKVHSTGVTGSASQSNFLYYDQNTITYGVDNAVFSSADGASFTGPGDVVDGAGEGNDSLPQTPPMEEGIRMGFQGTPGTYNRLKIQMLFTEVPGTVPSDVNLYRFVSPDFVINVSAYGANNADYPNIHCADYNFIWREKASVREYEYTRANQVISATVWTSPTIDNIRPAPTSQLPGYTIGTRESEKATIYQWDNDDAEWITGSGETIGGSVSGDHLYGVMKFPDNGEGTYAFINDVGGSPFIVKRGTTLPALGGIGMSATFYEGNGELNQRFALPFNGVKPGAMTIQQSQGKAVMGTDETHGQPVVFGDSPYTTGTFTGDGFPTGSVVTSLKWI